MTLKNPNFSKANYLYFVFWPIWTTLQVWALVGMGFSLELAFTDAVVSNSSLLILCIGLSIVMRYYSPSKNYAINILFWCLLLAAKSAWLSNYILVSFTDGNTTFHDFLDKSFVLRLSINFLIVGCFAMINWLLYYLNAVQELEKRKIETEKLAKDAELAVIRQQLQPHFLFNSLNSINALIAVKPEKAQEMVLQLSDFLRGTVRKEENKMLLLKDELAHLQLYLNIEKIRFSERLNVDVICSEEAEKTMIPALLLQPILENAIKFGLYDLTEKVSISINCHTDGAFLWIRVENPYDAVSNKPLEGTGYGLSSVKRRLDLLFARQDLLTTETINNQFICTLKIPR